jgi:hypothetical protein
LPLSLRFGPLLGKKAARLQEFDLVVVGDEPAGLWLLHHYSQKMKEHGGPGSLAWISLEKDHRPRSIPSRIASAFELQVSESWNLELLSPQQNLIWHPEFLTKRYPGLPDPEQARKDSAGKRTAIEDLTQWDRAWVAQVRKTLQRYPELYSCAQAVWKWMGRSLPTVSESQFLHAYSFYDFAYWDPSQMVPNEVSRISLATGLHPVEEFKAARSGSPQLTFRGFGSVSAKRWVWNLPWKQLTALCRRSPQLFQLMNPAIQEACAPHCLYGLAIEAESQAVPVPMRPLSIYLEDWHIPDNQTEMWPIQLFSFGQTKELCVWAGAPAEVTLEATQAAFLQAAERLYRLLPHLPRMTKSLSVGLDPDCSFHEQTRAAWFEKLYEARIELYQGTVSTIGARHSAFHLLVPAIDCHLPYPLGTLLAAKRLAKEWVPKKKPAPKHPENSHGVSAQAP